MALCRLSIESIETSDWNIYSFAPKDDCDSYGLCGVHGSCNINRSPKCECMKGFMPKFQNDWDKADWYNGCVRSSTLDCQKGEGFVKFSGVKLPDKRKSWFNRSMDLKECEVVCLSNCFCTAYTNLDIRDGESGCLLWFGDLIDIKEFNENGQEIYVCLRTRYASIFSLPEKHVFEKYLKEKHFTLHTCYLHHAPLLLLQLQFLMLLICDCQLQISLGSIVEICIFLFYFHTLIFTCLMLFTWVLMVLIFKENGSSS